MRSRNGRALLVGEDVREKLSKSCDGGGWVEGEGGLSGRVLCWVEGRGGILGLAVEWEKRDGWSGRLQ